MNSYPMNLSEETVSRGLYPFEGTYYGIPYPETERLTPPITPKDNALRYFSGKPCAWVPDVNADIVDITPDCNPDAIAQGYEGGLDAFGVKWIPVSSNEDLPAFVEPGFVLLEDIADWQELRFPDVDSWPWAEYGEKYRQTYKDDDRLLRGVIYSGFFERLISLMSFEEAAMAMVTDPDAVRAFFEALADMNIKIAAHYKEDFGCEAILLHDDWSAQLAPFFSPKLASEIIAPCLKRVVDFCHDNGMLFILHSCGNGTSMIPAMAQAGVDGWQAQLDAIDFEKSLTDCTNNGILLETYPFIDAGIGSDAKRALIRDVVDQAVHDRRWLPIFFDMDFENPEKALETRMMMYEEGRKAVQSVG